MAMTDQPEWAYRARCLAEKGSECVGCGASEVLVHHIDGSRDNNDLDNLVPLCDRCHRDVHAGSDEFPELVRALGKTPKPLGGKSTTIQISDETWERLDDRKSRGRSFDDVVCEALDALENGSEE